MKKVFLFFSLLFPALTGIAADTHWTPKTNVEYQKETVVYAQVYVNGRIWNNGSQNVVEIGAFIGDECRAVNTSSNASSSNNIIALRVVGSDDTDGDVGKTIVFRAYYLGIEYTFTKTTTFQGDATVSEVPFVLYLDAIAGIKVENPVTVNQRTDAFPYTVDLSSYVSLQYNAATAKGQSTPDVEMTIKGASQTSADVLSFDGAKATIKKAENASYSVTIVASINNKGSRTTAATYTGSTTLVVTISKISVSSITCDITDIDRFYAYDNLHDYLKDHLTILPANADNKEYKLECYDEGAEPDMTIPTKGGSYKVTIQAEDPDASFVAPSINVKVYVRPLSMSCNQREMTLKIGEETKSAIEKELVFSWPDQEDPGEWAAKDLEYTYNPADLVDASGKAIKTGETNVTAKLKEGVTVFQSATPGSSSVSVKVTIETAVSLSWRVSETAFYKSGQQATKPFAIVTVSNPEGESFDAEGIGAKFDERYEGYPYAELTQVKTTTGTEYELYLTPWFIGKDIPFGVNYNGSEIPCETQGTTSPTVGITAQPALAAGWNWIGIVSNAVEVSSALQSADLIEVRSQKGLLYNDATLGLFGDISTLSAGEALYKVRTNKATSATLGNVSAFAASQAYDRDIVVGYNWINNPYEFSISASRLSDFLCGITPDEGDELITKTGFAAYNAVTRSWTPQDFTLEAGQGVVYYSTHTGTLKYNAQLAPEGTLRKAAFPRNAVAEVFAYDAHAFADNMAMIANVEGLEYAEDYIVGVFVDGECRGNGRFNEDGILFVNAAGKAGEKLTFKLYNTVTEETFDLDETLTYSTRKGSLKEPVKLTAPVVTGIYDVDADVDVNSSILYNLAGQRINKMQKGISIVNGKKVAF